MLQIVRSHPKLWLTLLITGILTGESILVKGKLFIYDIIRNASTFLTLMSALAACTPLLVAQPFHDLLTTTTTYQFPAGYGHSDSGIFDRRNALSVGGELILPLELQNGDFLIAGVNLQRHRLGFEYVGSEASDHIRLNTTEFRLGLLHQWKNERHKTLFVLMPRWNGTHGTSLDRIYFQESGLVVHERRCNENLVLKLGLYYSNEFFGNYFVPLAGIDWKINEDLFLYGLLPANLHLHHFLNPSFAVSFSIGAAGGSFQMSPPESDHIRIGQGFPPFTLLSADAHIQVFKPLVCRISVGHTFWRKYGLYDTNVVKYETGPYADYKDGPFVRGSLIVRIDKQK